MKRKIFLRGVLGFPIGLAIGYAITIVISLVHASGKYVPCVPAFAEAMGSEINAVLLQALLCGVLGMGFAASSVIWEVERWNLVKQTGIYFAIISLIMMPVAYAAYWMEHSAAGFLRYFGIFALIFVLIWLVEFIIGRHNVKKMNENLHKTGGHDSD